MKPKRMFFAIFVPVLCLACCSSNSGGVGTATWINDDKSDPNNKIINGEYLKILGKNSYAIELDEYTKDSFANFKHDTKNADNWEAAGVYRLNEAYDKGYLDQMGCTAFVKQNSSNQLVFGRNMDVKITDYPAYVYKTSYGKYKTLGISYSPGRGETFENIQKNGNKIDVELREILPFIATDAFNEKGLYIQANMRTEYDFMVCKGTHSKGKNIVDGIYKGKGEDGVTDVDYKRCCSFGITQLVAQNCSTVKEALHYINWASKYDYYTMRNDNPVFDKWNFAFLLGDATGEYGLIEIAQDEVYYIPYQNSQGNFYIEPRLANLDFCGSGFGRVKKVNEILAKDNVNTLEQCMDEMKNVMWRHEMLWVDSSKRNPDASNPKNAILFVDDIGNPQLDYRSDYVGLWPTTDYGIMIVDENMYNNAQKPEVKAYDSKIIKYLDEALATGKLKIGYRTGPHSDEKFLIGGKEYTYSEIMSEEHEDIHNKSLENQSTYWCHDDNNFEVLKGMIYADLHTRYDDQWKFDATKSSKYEKLLKFYGYALDSDGKLKRDANKNIIIDPQVKDETPLRTTWDIWTTSLNIGVNCHTKELKLRLWENDKLIYHFKW